MKIIQSLSCRACQSRLLDYIHEDLSPELRRQVARHLQTCKDCHERYREQETVARDLSLFVPLIGQSHQPDFAGIFANIQSDMNRPRPTVSLSPARYGLALAALMLAFLVPLMLGSQRLTLASPPTQPEAVTLITPSASSTAPTSSETTVAYLTDVSQSTPEAPQQTIGPVAISTP